MNQQVSELGWECSGAADLVSTAQGEGGLAAVPATAAPPLLLSPAPQSLGMESNSISEPNTMRNCYSSHGAAAVQNVLYAQLENTLMLARQFGDLVGCIFSVRDFRPTIRKTTDFGVIWQISVNSKQ